MLDHNLIREADRQLTICNACRYCEGYCAVFPALELRRAFAEGDIVFLAHLCHDCRACYYACMYAPPHEFNVNIPQVLSEVRLASYRRLSWPAVLGRAFADRSVGVILGAAATGLVVVLTLLLAGPARVFSSHRGAGAFYEVIPYWTMVAVGIVLSMYVVAVWSAGGARFWLEGGRLPQPVRLGALLRAAGDVLNLRWLRGGGPGCYYPSARPSSLRRLFHGFVVYGFLAALASTTIAAVYQDLLNRLPPFALTSAPVVLGSAGGVAMVAGSVGLISLKARSDSRPAGTGAAVLDYIFLIILGLASLSGMLTLALRETPMMGAILTLHLGLVAALYVTAPYGKFVHFLYRYLAVLRHSLEQRAAKDSSAALPG